MGWLLNVVYLFAILAASPWLLYCSLRHGKYRQGWSAKLWGRVPRREGNRPCVWFHAVSVGEVNLLQPLIAQWEQEYTDWDVVVSTTTQTGYELAKKKYAPRTVFYAPLDFTWAIHNALVNIRPNLLVLAELEVWPNWLRAATRRNVPTAIINGRLGEKSFRRYLAIQRFIAPVFSRLALVAAQTDEYAERFRRLRCPANRVRTTGSLKFDGARSDRNNPITLRLAELAGIAPDDVVFLAGSTQSPEESLTLEAYERHASQHSHLKLLLVPRHPERFEEVAAMLDRRGVKWQRRSRLESEGRDPQARILLIDVVGELGAWWGTARIAFVGGSMGRRGGQNMIEPGAYGAAICFGPNTWNFRDVVSSFLAREAAVVVSDGNELTSFVGRCLTDPSFARRLGDNAAVLVREQQGATQRTMSLLRELLERPASNSPAPRVDGSHERMLPFTSLPRTAHRRAV